MLMARLRCYPNQTWIYCL